MQLRKTKNVLVYAKVFLVWAFQSGVVIHLFYQSFLLCLLCGIAAGIYGACTEKKREMRRQRERIHLEFREALQGMAAALQAGYSMENALQEAGKDLYMLYGDSSALLPQLQEMVYKIQLNQPVEYVFKEFADFAKVEDVTRFAQVLHIAKRTGGDLIAITKMTAERISEKLEVQREIASMIAGKRMEAKVMQMIPLGMILYFRICSPGFLEVLYRGGGRVVMTVLFAVYLFAYYWINRISRIIV